MEAKVAVVTGASGGLGSELCKLIAASQIKLVLVDRNLAKSKAFAEQLNGQHPGAVLGTFAVDLASHADIQRVVGEVMKQYPAIHYLFNNAGVLTETLQFSPHGNELHFEVNTLAPLQLIDGLRPALTNANGAMIVNTSAGLSLRAKKLDWDELLKPKTFEKLYGPYVNSKEALNVLTAALASELAADKIAIRAADPGPNQTGLTKGKGTPLWMRLFYWALPKPNQGAQRIFDPAVSKRWNGQSGVFISAGKVQSLPPACADKNFQREFLTRCRRQAAMTAAAAQSRN